VNSTVEQFEKIIADFYGAPYAISTDCCTHAIELCLRLQKITYAECPSKTYISIPFTFEKLKIKWRFVDYPWQSYYYLGDTNIIDAAVHWKEHGYITGTFMCLSFQYKKHLNLGRGGMILCSDKQDYEKLLKMRYDGRSNNIPWAEQNINSVGYHYYMTPETAELGIEKFPSAAVTPAKTWSYQDYPFLPDMDVFKYV
jgi:dTDP-4-amino-4,6-dideoxygalactose transaminase